MDTHATAAGFVPVVKFFVNLVSAVCGLVGAWLMAKRYARQPFISIVVALIWPASFIVGKDKRVRSFVTSEFKANRDLEDSAVDMALGLSLVFWAFLLQAIGLLIELWH
jgi:hypothetical protein